MGAYNFNLNVNDHNLYQKGPWWIKGRRWKGKLVLMVEHFPINARVTNQSGILLYPDNLPIADWPKHVNEACQKLLKPSGGKWATLSDLQGLI